MFYFLCAVVSYLIGSFPTGVFLTRRRYGLDVRDIGSGSIGATNVTRVFGWTAGLTTFLVDFLKGAVPLLFLYRNFPEYPWAITLSGIFLVIGHCYSLFLGFRGGKGVATSLGCLIMVIPWGALISGGCYLLFLMVTKISAVGSLAGMVSAILYLIWAKPQIEIIVLVAAISLIVFWRHKDNIRRLKETLQKRKTK